MDADPSAELVARWRDRHDEQAARELFDRYVERLIALARRHLPAAVAGRADPEDAVQSAYRSFFVRVRDGRLDFGPGDNLWRLLATITRRKVMRQVEVHTAGKRAAAREQAPGDGFEAAGREPSPEDAAAALDELQQVMTALEPPHRRIVQLRLQGHGDQEIATAVPCSERTVRRVLENLETRLRRRLDDPPSA